MQTTIVKSTPAREAELRRPLPTPGAWTLGFQEARPRRNEVLSVRGSLPADLRGTLYRNGPASFNRGGKTVAHWFDGDGAVQAFRLDGTSVSLSHQFVDTPWRRDELARDALVYGSYGGKRFLAPFGTRTKNAANTSVMVWRGRLLALYEGGKPWELSPEDLHTIGETTLDGTVTSTFSAHPHRVEARQTTYNIGLRYGRDVMLDVYALPDDGKASLLAEVRLPGPTMIHDFIATDRHLVFFVSPIRMRTLPVLLGRMSFSDSLAWRPELGTEVIVVPIDSPRDVKRSTMDAFYQWHFANAFERGNEIVVDVVAYPDFRSNEVLGALPRGEVRGELNGELHRVVVDSKTARATRERTVRRFVEFPRVSPTVEGAPHRFVWAGSRPTAAAKEDVLPTSIVRFDTTTGELREHAFARDSFVSEPVFVPRANATSEDDGYVLSVVLEGSRGASTMVVLDGRRPEDGPIARAEIDGPLPFTFHGVFAAA